MTTISRTCGCKFDDEVYVVAKFERSVEALICLPAIGRLLQCNLFLSSDDGSPSNHISLPYGCSFEQGGIVYRHLP